jgi:hypothetical protein
MLKSHAPVARTKESFLTVRNLALGIGSAIFIGKALSYYPFTDSYDTWNLMFSLFIAILVAVLSTWHLFVIKRHVLGIAIALTPLLLISIGFMYGMALLDDGFSIFVIADFYLSMIVLCIITGIFIPFLTILYDLQPKASPYIAFGIIFVLIISKPPWKDFVHWLIAHNILMEF